MYNISAAIIKSMNITSFHIEELVQEKGSLKFSSYYVTIEQLTM